MHINQNKDKTICAYYACEYRYATPFSQINF